MNHVVDNNVLFAFHYITVSEESQAQNHVTHAHFPLNTQTHLLSPNKYLKKPSLF